MTKRVEIKTDRTEKYRVIADTFRKNIEVDVKETSADIKETEPRSTYEQCLPESLSMKEVQAVEDYNANFISGVALGLGEEALEIYQKNKKVTEVNANIDYFGKGSKLNVSSQREETYPNPAPGGESITKHNVIKVQATTKSAKGASPKPLFKDISEYSLETIGKGLLDK